jgi:hypothetical protein
MSPSSPPVAEPEANDDTTASMRLRSVSSADAAIRGTSTWSNVADRDSAIHAGISVREPSCCSTTYIASPR